MLLVVNVAPGQLEIVVLPIVRGITQRGQNLGCVAVLALGKIGVRQPDGRGFIRCPHVFGLGEIPFGQGEVVRGQEDVGGFHQVVGRER